MATSTETKIIEIKVPIGEGIKQIKLLTDEIERLRAGQANLKKGSEAEKLQYEKNAISIKEYTRQKTVLQREVQTEIKDTQSAMSAYQKLQTEYTKAAANAKNLAAAHGVGSEKAKAAADNAFALGQRLKDIDASVNQHQRNVGNYTNSILEAIDALTREKNILIEKQKALTANQKALDVNSKEYKQLGSAIKENEIALQKNGEQLKENQKELGTSANAMTIFGGRFGGMIQGVKDFTTANGGLAGSFKAGGQAVLGFGKQLLALLANPIVAIIAAIAGAVMLLVNAMKQNGAATEKFNQILAPFKAILAAITAVLGQLVSVILDGVLVIGKWANAIMALIPGLDKVAERNQEAIRLEREKQKLIREGIVDKAADAKEELRISELKKKIMQADKYSVEQRLAFAREVDKAEKALALDDANRANRNLKNFLNNMKLQGKAQKDYTIEELQTLTDLQAKKYQEQQAYYDKTRRTASREATLIKEIETEKEAAGKASFEILKKQQEEFTAKKKADEEKRLADLRAYLAEQDRIINQKIREYEKSLEPKEATLLDKVTTEATAVINASIAKNTAIVAADDEATRKQQENAEKLKQKKIQAAFDTANASADILQGAFNFTNALAEAELATWAKQNKGKANFDEEYAKKRAELEHKAAVRNKVMQVVNSLINTAAAVVAQLSVPGAGPALAIAAGIAGALETAAIIATPIPDKDATSGATSMGRGSSSTPDLTSKMASPLTNSVQTMGAMGGSNAITSGAANVGVSPAFDYNAMAKIMSNMPAPELSIVELRTKERQVDFIDNISTLKS